MIVNIKEVLNKEYKITYNDHKIEVQHFFFQNSLYPSALEAATVRALAKTPHLSKQQPWHDLSGR